MSKFIGVENFRIFKDFTEFEIRPITLLTGPNNSGKSSLTKLLLLLQNGLQKLDFETAQPNLESYENIISWNAKNDCLKIMTGNTISLLNENYTTEFTYQNGKIIGVAINSATFERKLLNMKFSHGTRKDRLKFKKRTMDVNLDIEHLINLVYHREFEISGFKYTENSEEIEEGTMVEHKTILKDVEFQYTVDTDLSAGKLKDKLASHLKNKGDTAHMVSKEWRNMTLTNEIGHLKRDFLLYDIIHDNINLSETRKDLVLNIQNQVFDHLKIEIPFMEPDFNSAFDVAIDNINSKAKIEIERRIKEELDIESLIVKERDLGNLLFKEHLFFGDFEPLDEGWNVDLYQRSYYQRSYFRRSFIQEFKTLSFSLKDYLGEFSYISPQRGNMQRVLMNKSDHEIDEIILQYHKLGDRQKNIPFLQKVLHILEIEGDLRTIRHENYISIVYLQRNGHEVSLADLGYGYSQIIPIVLKIILTMSDITDSEKNKNLIIEEPEANLHPNLQSKLANVLMEGLKHYPKINFIVETHSEYLIRKLQYLTAKNSLRTDQTAIYYFNADQYVSSQEPKVKKIEITGNGNLTDTFGPGFYDEATRLQFNLMRINSDQQN